MEDPSARPNLRDWRDALLELLFPGSHLCSFCWQSINEQKIRGVCSRCTAKIMALGRVRTGGPAGRIVSVAPYTGAYREMITEFKFSGRLELGKPLGYLMARKAVSSGLAARGTVLVPVPLHPSREAERGFNQSSRLAREIASLLGLRCDEAALKRVSYEKNQTRLGKWERAANMRAAFAADQERSEGIAGRSILLIDDIVTTGATLEACAEALRRSGPAGIAALTWAFGVAKNNFQPGQEEGG